MRQRLLELACLNQMLRLMAKDKRSIEADKKAAEDEEGRLRTELVKYVGLEEQAAELERASGLIKELAELNDCQAQLTAILQDREAIKRGSHFLDADTDGLKIDLARLADLRAAQDAVLSANREEWAPWTEPLRHRRHGPAAGRPGAFGRCQGKTGRV